MISDYVIVCSKFNSEKGHNSDMKRKTDQLFYHEDSVYEISKTSKVKKNTNFKIP